MADTQSQQRTKRDILQAMMTLLRKKKFDDMVDCKFNPNFLTNLSA